MTLDVDYVVRAKAILITLTNLLDVQWKVVVLWWIQMIEAKEAVPIIRIKDICFDYLPNLFRMYRSCQGWQGLVRQKKKEFREIYNIRVIPIPTLRPVNVSTKICCI